MECRVRDCSIFGWTSPAKFVEVQTIWCQCTLQFNSDAHVLYTKPLSSFLPSSDAIDAYSTIVSMSSCWHARVRPMFAPGSDYRIAARSLFPGFATCYSSSNNLFSTIINEKNHTSVLASMMQKYHLMTILPSCSVQSQNDKSHLDGFCAFSWLTVPHERCLYLLNLFLIGFKVLLFRHHIGHAISRITLSVIWGCVACDRHYTDISIVCPNHCPGFVVLKFCYFELACSLWPFTLTCTLGFPKSNTIFLSQFEGKSMCAMDLVALKRSPYIFDFLSSTAHLLYSIKGPKVYLTLQHVNSLSEWSL